MSTHSSIWTEHETIAANFVPRLLNSDQRDHRVQVCTELQEAVRHDPNFLSRGVTGDES